MTKVLMAALTTGAFCACFAVLVHTSLGMLTLTGVIGISGVSGFLGSLFAYFVLGRGRD